MDRKKEMIEKLREILCEVLKNEKDPSEILENTDLLELGLNSLNAIEMVVYLEDTFEIEISDEDLMLENLSSINMICDMLKNYGVNE